MLFLFGISSLVAAGATTQTVNTGKTDKNMPVSENKQEIKIQPSNKTEKGYDLNFNTQNYIKKAAEVNGKTIEYRAYENIVYVKNPVDVNYQTINIYIPEEYFNNKYVGKYNAKNAPIFFPNSVGGYMPGAAGTVGMDKRSGKENA